VVLYVFTSSVNWSLTQVLAGIINYIYKATSVSDAGALPGAPYPQHDGYLGKEHAEN
jgi:hypothetical protein